MTPAVATRPQREKISHSYAEMADAAQRIGRIVWGLRLMPVSDPLTNALTLYSHDMLPLTLAMQDTIADEQQLLRHIREYGIVPTPDAVFHPGKLIDPNDRKSLLICTRCNATADKFETMCQSSAWDTPCQGRNLLGRAWHDMMIRMPPYGVPPH